VVASLVVCATAAAVPLSIAPERKRHGMLTFKLSGIDPAAIRAARVGVGSRLRLSRSARGWRLAKVLLLLSLDPGRKPTPSEPTLHFPIRMAFYYPWFPQTWTVGGVYTHFHPSLGYYSSDDATLQQAHIRALDYAGVDAAISEWRPSPSYLDSRLKAMLGQTVTLRSALKWAIYYSPEGSSDPAPRAIAANLAYVRDTLAPSPAYARVDGRFVVFVWSSGPSDATCSLAARWKAANARIGNAAYVVLKVFPGYRDCASQPDGWHQYAPATAAAVLPGHSYSVSPGFWRANDARPRLTRAVRRFEQGVRAMVASGAPWQLVTTFNEWGEGTAVESAAEWQTASGEGAYLDALHAALRPTGPASAHRNRHRRRALDRVAARVGRPIGERVDTP
jgi:hypothetical protein